MGLLTMKFDEASMLEALCGGLLPAEQLLAAIYVSYQELGFWNSRGVQAGYLGLTDHDRLIGVRYGLVGSAPFSVQLGLEKRLKVKKGLLGSRVIDLDTGMMKLRITATTRVGSGTNLPHQTEYFQTIISALEARQMP